MNEASRGLVLFIENSWKDLHIIVLTYGSFLLG